MAVSCLVYFPDADIPLARALLLHRNALLINSQVIKAELDLHFADKPFRFRLRNGQNLCCSAARSIVSILTQVYENDACSALSSSHAPLIAVYVLAIYIIKNPHSGLAKADFEVRPRRRVTQKCAYSRLATSQCNKNNSETPRTNRQTQPSRLPISSSAFGQPPFACCYSSRGRPVSNQRE